MLRPALEATIKSALNRTLGTRSFVIDPSLLVLQSTTGRKFPQKVSQLSESRHKMSPLQLVLLFALHIRVSVCLKGIRLYSRSGSDVVLSCDRESDSDCSRILWFYSRNRETPVDVVKDGRVQSESSRAARLKLIAGCSLIISNITAEDIGQYVCRYGKNQNNDVVTFLGVLTLSVSPADADPEVNSEVTLKCSMHRDSQLSACKDNSIQWLDETGNVLPPGEGVKGCDSFLKVRRQSGRRTFTCRFVDERNIVEVEADYTLDFPDETEAPPPTPAPERSLSVAMFAVRLSGLSLLIIITAVVSICTRNRKSPDPSNKVSSNTARQKRAVCPETVAASRLVFRRETTTKTTSSTKTTKNTAPLPRGSERPQQEVTCYCSDDGATPLSFL
ncbi:uncharacterized protein V6R79_008218 [Siganus canaliculatus]